MMSSRPLKEHQPDLMNWEINRYFPNKLTCLFNWLCECDILYTAKFKVNSHWFGVLMVISICRHFWICLGYC